MVRSAPTLPTKTGTKGGSTTIVRGKRTGTVMESPNLKDMNAALEGVTNEEPALSPPKEKVVESPQKKQPERPKRRVREPRAVRMSLRGTNNDDNEEENQDKEKAKAYPTKLAKAKSRQPHLALGSPSELSHVSTAPPTPREPQDSLMGMTTPSPQQLQDEFITQPEEEEEEGVFPQAASAESAEKPLLMTTTSPAEASFPVADTEEQDDDDDDDLGPPALPDDDDDDDRIDEEEEAHKEPPGKTPQRQSLVGDEQKPAAKSSLSDTDSEDDNDNDGYNMVHDPETPKSVRDRRAKKEKARLEEKKKKSRRKSTGESDSEQDDDDEDQTPRQQKTKRRKKRANVIFSPQGIPTANRDYETVPVGDLVEESSGDGLRRSRRAKCQPLAYWKNERSEYGAHDETGILGEAMGDMPVVKHIVKALPTPYRKRKPTNTKRQTKQKRAVAAGHASDEEEELFDTSRLRRKYKVIDGENAHLWDDVGDDSADLKVVSYASLMEASDLPISSTRTKQEGKVVGRAAQAFNILNDDNDTFVGYIMGNLQLPPKGIKDAESVGPCSQTFTVCHCQPRALEVAYGDPDLPEGSLDPESAQRFYLSPGDLFRVPPGNCYRLENHSSTKDCLLTWTIIRPRHMSTTT